MIEWEQEEEKRFLRMEGWSSGVDGGMGGDGVEGRRVGGRRREEGY